MRYCNKCKITIDNNSINCPLCDSQTTKINNKFETDFPVQKDSKRENIIIVRKVFIFIFVFLLGLNLLIGSILSNSLIWAPYSFIPLLYAYIIISLGIRSYRKIGSIVMSSVFMISIICIIIDFLIGFTGWSFNYIIPFTVLSGILALFIFMIVKPTYFFHYLIAMFIIAFFGITIIIFLLTGLVTVQLPSIITVFISFMSLVAMFMFGDRDIKHELVKRFHF